MTPDVKNETAITTPSDTQIRMEREFDAPRELVWEAHADPELLGQWLGPHESNLEVSEMDFRVGGSYLWTEGEITFYGEFREIKEPEVIEQTFEFSGAPGHGSVDRLELFELEGGRTKLVVTSTFASQEDRDGMLQSGMEKGVNEGYVELDALLAERQR